MTPEEQWQAWNEKLTYDMRSRSDPMNMGRIPWFVQNPWDAQVPEDYLSFFGSDYAGIVAAQKAAWEQHTGLKYDPTAAYNKIDGLGRRTARGVFLTPEAWENNPGPRPTQQIHFAGTRTSPPSRTQVSQSRAVPSRTQISQSRAVPTRKPAPTSTPNAMPAFDMAPAPAPAAAPAPAPAAAPAPRAQVSSMPQSIVPSRGGIKANTSAPRSMNTYNRRTI